MKTVMYDYDTVQKLIAELNQLQVTGVGQARCLSNIATYIETGKVMEKTEDNKNENN